MTGLAELGRAGETSAKVRFIGLGIQKKVIGPFSSFNLARIAKV
jgi:hypothetical protein